MATSPYPSHHNLMTKDSLSLIYTLAQTQLRSAFATMPEDKIGWKPHEDGRCALDLFSEAAQNAAVVARLLESRGTDQPTAETFQRLREERTVWTREFALEQLDKNGAALQAALLSLTDEEMQKPVTLASQGNNTWPLGLWTMMSYRVNVARFAQINYIQTLYGDFVTH